MKQKQNVTENNKTEGCGMTKDQMIEEMRKINAKHKDNMESRKNALKILMSGIPIGNKVFVIVPVEDLHIDESYQRPVHATVKYPQFKDESKKLKLFLLDIVNGDDDPAGEVIGGQGRFIA